MPRHRPEQDEWQEIRHQVWLRDKGLCQGPYCRGKGPLLLHQCHIDHIQSGKVGSNALHNLRILCRRCHSLRIDQRHRGLTGRALQDGLIPVYWRKFAWDEGLHWPSEETIAELNQWIMMQENNDHEK